MENTASKFFISSHLIVSPSLNFGKYSLLPRFGQVGKVKFEADVCDRNFGGLLIVID